LISKGEKKLETMSNEKILKFGIPKGSLEESTKRLFNKAGWRVSTSGRSYFPNIDDPEMSCLLARAQEMARYVETGTIDAGLTGRDWVLESGADVVKVAELKYSKGGFGEVKWVVAVPKGSEIRTIKDLKGRKVSTELVNFTRAFLRKKGIRAQVEFSWGATEAKVPDLADAIVELTETGNSLRAHNLEVIATLLKSSTVLIANRSAWRDPWKKNKIKNIATLLKAALLAEERVGLKMNVSKAKLDKVVGVLPAMHTPTVSSQIDGDWVALEVITDEKIVRDLIPKLLEAGATGIVEYPLNKVIE
jgi:ATP phosphoribosyltransferase